MAEHLSSTPDPTTPVAVRRGGLASATAAGGRAGQTLADQVLQAIQSAIVQGHLAPGTKLNEPILAQEYGISRGPLREALRRLEARRLVELIPHSGARVVSLTTEQLLAIYQTREALEGMAARLAATRMADAQIRDLERLLDAHEVSIERDQGRRYYQEEGDFDFHYRVVQGAGNPLLAGVLLDDLYHLMRMYRFNRAHANAYQARPQRALAEHRRIVEAIADRDGELAEILMRRHIGAACRWIQTGGSAATHPETPEETRT